MAILEVRMGNPIVWSCSANRHGNGRECYVDSTQPLYKIREAIARKLEGSLKSNYSSRNYCSKYDIVFTGWKHDPRFRYTGYGYYCLDRDERSSAPKEGNFVYHTAILRTPLSRQSKAVTMSRNLTEKQIKYAIAWHYNRHDRKEWCPGRRIVLQQGKTGFDGKTCQYVWSCWKPGQKKPQTLRFDRACLPKSKSAAKANLKALTEQIKTIRNTKIVFMAGSHVLTAKAKGQLQFIASILKKTPDLDVLLTGHTSSEGGGHKTLSQKRANAVYWYLDKLGVNVGHYRTKAYGETIPTGKGRVYDRRVEFQVGQPRVLYLRTYTERRPLKPNPRRKPMGVCRGGWKPVRIRVADLGGLRFKVVPCGNNPVLVKRRQEAERKKRVSEFLKNLVWTLTPDLRANIFTRHRLVDGEATDTGFQISAAHWGTLPSNNLLLGGWQYGVAYSGGRKRNLLDVSAGIAGGLKFSKSQLRLEVDIGGTFLLSGDEDLAATRKGGFLRYALNYTHMLGRWIGIGGHVSVQHPWKRMDRPSIFFGPHMTVRFKAKR